MRVLLRERRVSPSSLPKMAPRAATGSGLVLGFQPHPGHVVAEGSAQEHRRIPVELLGRHRGLVSGVPDRNAGLQKVETGELRLLMPALAGL